MSPRVIPGIFLIVSIVSLCLQSGITIRIYRQPTHRAGILRTAGCRIGVGVIYVSLGVVAMFTSLAATGLIALSVFSATQIVWVLNGFLDLRITGRPKEVIGYGGDRATRLAPHRHGGPQSRPAVPRGHRGDPAA